MDSLNKLKLDIYESSLDNKNKHELIDIINMYRNKINKNDIFTEKKTREEYRVERFKKKYNFKPDKPGSKTGTILVDGKRQNIDIDVYKRTSDLVDTESPRQTSADLVGKDGTIVIDDKFFKLKNDKRRDAILHHEIGHTRMHTVNADSKNSDDRFVSGKNYGARRKATFDTYKNLVGLKDKVSKENRKILNDAVDRAIDAVGIDSKKYLDKAKQLKANQDNKERNEIYDYLQKSYSVKGVTHSNPQEFEADRYAANKSGEKNLKKGLQEYSKRLLTDQNIAKLNEIDMNVAKDISKKVRDNNQKDYVSRIKALKDKRMKKSNLYK